MRQIQDPITETAGVIGVGKLIRTRDEIHRYINSAMLNFIDAVWDNVEADKRMLLQKLPDIKKTQQITFPLNKNKLDLSNSDSGNFRDMLDVLDSYKSDGTFIEVWNPDRLSDAQTGKDPYYTGTIKRPGIIYSKPNLYLFPASLVSEGDYVFILNYLSRPVNPETGEYLVSNGDYDIPFDDKSIQKIADIATTLYKVDDNQEDPG